MRIYEMMLVLDPDMAEEGIQSTLQKVTTLVTDRKGELLKSDEWGLRSLSYPIKSKDKGYYVLSYLRGTPGVIAELDRSLRLMEEVLRHLVIRKEKGFTVPVTQEQERGPEIESAQEEGAAVSEES